MLVVLLSPDLPKKYLNMGKIIETSKKRRCCSHPQVLGLFSSHIAPALCGGTTVAMARCLAELSLRRVPRRREVFTSPCLRLREHQLPLGQCSQEAVMEADGGRGMLDI